MYKNIFCRTRYKDCKLQIFLCEAAAALYAICLGQ